MLRGTPTKVGRALADRLYGRPGTRPTTLGPELRVAAVDPFGPGSQPKQPWRPSRPSRLRRLLTAARVTPYQLRRGWLW